MVHFGDKELLCKKLHDLITEPELKEIKEIKSLCFSFLFESKAVLLYMSESPSCIDDLAKLQHEILHCVSFVLNSVGIKFNAETEEAYAYFMQYVTNIIYDKIGISIS